MHKFIKSIAATILLIFGVTTSASAALTAEYTNLGVPTDVNTSFKTYMDWRCITNKASAQYKLIRNWGWHDENGFMRATGEKDLGVTDDYYLIALGSYYGSTMGTKYRITTDTGNVFYGMLADQKADIHTDNTNRYARNNDVVEFLVDTRYLRRDVKRMGSANIHSPLTGHISKIERIDFIESDGKGDESTCDTGDTSIMELYLKGGAVWNMPGIICFTYDFRDCGTIVNGKIFDTSIRL